MSKVIIIVRWLHNTKFYVTWTVSIMLITKCPLTHPTSRFSSIIALREWQVAAFTLDVWCTFCTLVPTVPFGTLATALSWDWSISSERCSPLRHFYFFGFLFFLFIIFLFGILCWSRPSTDLFTDDLLHLISGLWRSIHTNRWVSLLFLVMVFDHLSCFG